MIFYSPVLRGVELSIMIAFALLLQSLAHGAEPLAKPSTVCLSTVEARREIGEHHLPGSFKIMQALAKKYRSEALAGKLCRRGDQFYYAITLLRRDGRVIHVDANANDGIVTKTRNDK